jgi:hypothetical protein
VAEGRWVEVEDDETGEVFEAWEDEETGLLLDEDGEQLDEVVDDEGLALEVDELRDRVPISSGQEIGMLDHMDATGEDVEDAYRLTRGARPSLRPDRRRQVDLAMVMAHEAGEAPLGDDGREQRLIDLDDDDVPPRLDEED